MDIIEDFDALFEDTDRSITEAPAAHALIAQIDDTVEVVWEWYAQQWHPVENVFDWYAQKYLFGSLAPCHLLTSGRILTQNEKVPFDLRLETFIRIIQRRREPVAPNGTEILSNDQYYRMLICLL